MSLPTIILAFIALCIPIYFLIGRGRFVTYLTILFTGSLIQQALPLFFHNADVTLLILCYDGLGVLMCTMLMVYVVWSQLDVNILTSKRFLVGLGFVPFGYIVRFVQGQVAISDTVAFGLVTYYVIFTMCVGIILHKGFKESRDDGGILLSILISAISYICLYKVFNTSGQFFENWMFVWVFLSGFWLLSGMKILTQRWRSGGKLYRHLSFDKDSQ